MSVELKSLEPVKYVVGFMFDTFMNQVVLVRKERPEWQAGRINGVGGHVENGESFLAAMIREFGEETGVYESGWRTLCHLKALPEEGPPVEVMFFFARAGDEKIASVHTTTDEQIVLVKSQYSDEMLPNLEWLLPMAKSINKGEDRATSFTILEVY